MLTNTGEHFIEGAMEVISIEKSRARLKDFKIQVLSILAAITRREIQLDQLLSRQLVSLNRQLEEIKNSGLPVNGSLYDE